MLSDGGQMLFNKTLATSELQKGTKTSNLPRVSYGLLRLSLKKLLRLVPINQMLLAQSLEEEVLLE